MANIKFTHNQPTVTVVAIDPDMKSIWMRRPDNEHELDYWESFHATVESGEDIFECAYKVLAPYELWPKSLSIISDSTIVSSHDKPALSRRLLVAGYVWTKHDKEHHSADGKWVLRSFTHADLSKLQDGGSSPYDYADILDLV